jgi:hypothetical protein
LRNTYGALCKKKMAGGAYRQVFRESFHDAEYQGLPPIHNESKERC